VCRVGFNFHRHRVIPIEGCEGEGVLARSHLKPRDEISDSGVTDYEVDGDGRVHTPINDENERCEVVSIKRCFVPFAYG